MSSRREPPPPLPSGPREPYIDWGPALPATYGVTRVVALVRDPGMIFAWWEGGDTLRIRDLTAGTERVEGVSLVGSWYGGAEPEHEYEIDLLAGGRVVAVSNRIRTPRRGPATAVDPEWVPTPQELEVLGQLAGSLRLDLSRPSRYGGSPA